MASPTDESEEEVFRVIFPCPYRGCEKTYPHREQLERHIQLVHLHRDSFICSECGRGFSDKRSLVRHMGYHKNSTPFPCFFCESRFIKACYRVTHVLESHGKQLEQMQREIGEELRQIEEKGVETIPSTPSDVTDIKQGERGKEMTREEKIKCLVTCRMCPVCSYYTAYVSSLKEHISGNHKKLYELIFGERPSRLARAREYAQPSSDVEETPKKKEPPSKEEPVSCPVCGKVLQARNVRRHIKVIHEGGSPLTCTVCGESFRSYEAFSKHRMDAHGIAKWERVGKENVPEAPGDSNGANNDKEE